MRRGIKTMTVLTVVALSFFSAGVRAQDETPKGPQFTAGADFYSNYIWRGTKYGKGPAFQPTVKMTAGGFAAGVWGSFDASGYSETDPYLSYSFPFGLSVGITSYYYPMLGGSFLADSSNGNEINLGFAKAGFSFSGNYMLNKATTAGTMGGDLYFQAGYAFKKVGISVGAGNGWHTLDDSNGKDKFNVCHIGINTSKEIKITDSFTIPVSGQIIYNPDTRLLFLVVGFSL